MRRPNNRDAGDRGAVAVEFALLFIFVLGPFLTAFVTFALAFNAQINISQGAREGARLAAICNLDATCLGTGDQSVKDKVINGVGSNLTILASNIAVTECTAATAGNPKPVASVTVTYVSNVGLPPFASTGITLTGKATTPCGG